MMSLHCAEDAPFGDASTDTVIIHVALEPKLEALLALPHFNLLNDVDSLSCPSDIATKAPHWRGSSSSIMMGVSPCSLSSKSLCNLR